MAMGRGMPPPRPKMAAPMKAPMKPKRGRPAKAAMKTESATDMRKVSDNRADPKYTMPAATTGNGEDDRARGALVAKAI
jgi:hypothetical protein